MFDLLGRQSKAMRAVATGIFLLTTSAFAAQAQELTIEIVKRGIYDNGARNRAEGIAPRSGLGRHSESTPALLESTTVIPAELGREFGFEFNSLGMEAGNVLELTLVTEFPAQGIYDPETDKTIYRDERTIRSASGLRGYQGYVLDAPSEVVPGIWTFKIMYRDQLLASQSFTLVSP